MEEYQDRSLRGRVFQRLREDILSGAYQEGDELREITVGEELGVSRTPVREALRQLELEGLVTIIPNKGAYVTGYPGRMLRTYIRSARCWKECAQSGRRSILRRNRSKSWRRSFCCLNSICIRRAGDRRSR